MGVQCGVSSITKDNTQDAITWVWVRYDVDEDGVEVTLEMEKEQVEDDESDWEDWYNNRCWFPLFLSVFST